MGCHWRILSKEEKRSDLEGKDHSASVDSELEVERAAETGKTVSAREEKRSWKRNV